MEIFSKYLLKVLLFASVILASTYSLPTNVCGSEEWTYVPSQGLCYHLSTYESGILYSEAEVGCGRIGGHLATPLNEQQNIAISEVIREAGASDYNVWLGLYRQTASPTETFDERRQGWMWVSGLPFNPNGWTGWAVNEPGVMERFVRMRNGQWLAIDNQVDANYYICQKAPSPVTGTPYMTSPTSEYTTPTAEPTTTTKSTTMQKTPTTTTTKSTTKSTTTKASTTTAQQTTSTEKGRKLIDLNENDKKPLAVLMKKPDELLDLTHTEDTAEVVVGNLKPYIPKPTTIKPTTTTTTERPTPRPQPTQKPQQPPQNPPKYPDGGATPVPDKDPNQPPLAQKLTAEVFNLYPKWHGAVVQQDDQGSQKVMCDVNINHVTVTDDSKLNGDGKLFGEDFTFTGNVAADGELDLTFSDNVASKLANCSFTDVSGHLYYDPNRGVWTYRGQTPDETEETFVLEPIDETGSTTQRMVGTPKFAPGPDDYEIKNDKNAWLALVVCGGLLFLLLFGFLLGRAIAG